MDSFQGAAAAAFCYGSRAESSMADVSDHIGGEEEEAFSASVDVYVHHACNIHNICIYANQDVYAKFSLTCSPEEAVSTRIVAGGGKNPQFEERLKVKVTRPDAVLKCEIWMMSRARNYMEDQLLGFALVPLSLVADGGELTQDFALSSTDLFHSPAGSVRLTLSLDASRVEPSNGAFAAHGRRSSISSEVVILDPAVDYEAIEFPDINIAQENQKMVSEYFDMAAANDDGSSLCREIGGAGTAAAGQFLHLGAPIADHDMNSSSSDSLDGSMHNSGPFSVSTTTSLSDDRASANSSDKKNSCNEIHHNSGATQPDTPTSRHGERIGESRSEPTKLLNRGDDGANLGEQRTGGSTVPSPMASVFAAPLGDINVQAEQSAMQQQIVDMYMKSMQQFTESLAKMKLPMDLDMPSSDDGRGGVIQSQNDNSSSRSDANKRKDGPRVFYGSRAFF